MQWVEENNKYYPTLRVFTQLNPNSTHPNKLRIKELIVVNPETNEILVQDQYDKKASFSNAKFSQNADQFDYRLEYPTFYYSQDYSVLQKRSDMRWLIKGTLHHAENETRVYFKIKHPNDPLTKKLASNKKNMFVFIAIGFFIGGLVLSLMYLKASIEQLKHDKQYSDIIVAVLGVIAVIYFIFYKMIWLWLQIEF